MGTTTGNISSSLDAYTSAYNSGATALGPLAANSMLASSFIDPKSPNYNAAYAKQYNADNAVAGAYTDGKSNAAWTTDPSLMNTATGKQVSSEIQAAQANQTQLYDNATESKLQPYAQQVVSDLNSNNFAGAWQTAENTAAAYGTTSTAATEDPLLQAMESSQGLEALDPSKKWTSAEDTSFYDALGTSAGAKNGNLLGANPYGQWGNIGAMTGGTDAKNNVAQDPNSAPNAMQFAGAKPTTSFMSKYGAPIIGALGTVVGSIAGDPTLGATLGAAASDTANVVAGHGDQIGAGGLGAAALQAVLGSVPGAQGSLANAIDGGAAAGSVGADLGNAGAGAVLGAAKGAVSGGGTGALIGAVGGGVAGGVGSALGTGGAGLSSGIAKGVGSVAGGLTSSAVGGALAGSPTTVGANPNLVANNGSAPTAGSGVQPTSSSALPYLGGTLGAGSLGSFGVQGNSSNMAGTDTSLASTITGALPGVLQAGIGTAGSLAAANAETNADQNAITTQQGNLANINSIWSTQQQTGQGANTALQSSLGLNGQTANPSNFLNMPGYQFAVQQGTQAIQRQAAAMGNAYTPNTAAAVGQYVTGTASQDYNTYISQLMGAAGLGTTANQGLQTGSQQSSNNISQLQQNIGQAQAAGYSGVASSAGGLFSPNGAGTGLIGAAGNYLGGSGVNGSGVPQGNGTTSSNASDPFAGTTLANNQNAINAYDQSNGPTAGDISNDTYGATTGSNSLGNIDMSGVGGDSPIGGFMSDDSFGDDLSSIF